VSNFRSNSAFGQIPAIISRHHLIPVPRVGHIFVDHPLEIIIGEARECSSVLLESYGRLADFVVSKLIAEEIYCSNIELLKSIRTDLFHDFDYVCSRMPVYEYVEPS